MAFNIGDILDQLGGASGGDATQPVGESVPKLDEFVADAEGATLVKPYGEHVIRGVNVAKLFTEGSSPDSRYINALGDGGRHGWDSIVQVWHNGSTTALAAAGDNTTTARGLYRFHEGTISTSITDPTQPVDPWFASGLAYNATAVLAVRHSEDYATEEAPSQTVSRVKCLKCMDYDKDGNALTAIYTTNPAMHVLEEVYQYHLNRLKSASLALAALQDQIDWPYWFDWKTYNAEEISWNNGTSTVNIARFESHVALAQEHTLAEVLDIFCAVSGARWQETGGKLRFLTPDDETIALTIDESMIVPGSFTFTPLDGQVRPNTLIARFRNLDDTYLSYGYVEAIDETRQQREGRRRPQATRDGQFDREFPAMRYSQAQRLIRRQLEIEAKNPFTASFRMYRPGAHLLKGDFVSLSHRIPNWTNQKCAVLAVGLDLGATINEVELNVQAINTALYSDDWHGVVQPAI